MPIPSTGGRYATLPVGRHLATPSEIYDAFVEGAPYEERRQLIFRALCLYMELVAAEFTSARFWIDGGFVTHKSWEAPEDADVVVVVPQAEHGKAMSPALMPFWSLIDARPSQPSVHSPKVHPMGGLIDAFIEPDNPMVLDVWDYRWSSVRDEQHNVVNGVRKGYLEVSM